MKLNKYKKLYTHICDSMTIAQRGIIELRGQNAAMQSEILHIKSSVDIEKPNLLARTEAKENLMKAIYEHERDILSTKQQLGKLRANFNHSEAD